MGRFYQRLHELLDDPQSVLSAARVAEGVCAVVHIAGGVAGKTR